MEFKLTKIETIVMNFYLFAKRPKEEVDALINRFKRDRLLEQGIKC